MVDAVTVGLDVGTSGLKVSVYSLSKEKVIQNFVSKYKEPAIDVGISTVDRFVDTIISSLNAISEKNVVKSAALSVQMYSFVVIRNKKEVVYQWNVPWHKDAEVEKILERFVDISGCPVDTLFPSYKILAARKDPNFKGEIQPYGLQEAIINRLTGKIVGDWCNVSSYGFINVRKREWNEELLKLAGFNKAEMPKLVKFNDPVGVTNNPKIIQSDPITIACGLGDGPSASYASAGTSSMAANIGTSMAVRAFVHNIDGIDFHRVWTYVVDNNTWCVGGISSNGSAVLDHFRDVDVIKDWEVKPETADQKVKFFPWKYGERTPYWSSSLKETMLGGDSNSTMNDYRASIFRGVAFTLATMYSEAYKVVKENKATLVVAGGGAKSDILMEYLSGTLPVPMGILEDFDYLGSYGAAYIAGEAIGSKPSKNQYLVKVYNPTMKYVRAYGEWRETANYLAKFYNSTDFHVNKNASEFAALIGGGTNAR
ncbi:FGGY family carbohydrate kinase [Companilactobacillus huachuanensis]|uniref:FGGY family carbohydrate kinase n=1 Tax=Companilactobacillus huachuanensis TaxID=2559914 RepID=A0ABW1RQE3_9LACO|nr:FGGY family carbohydrate kinase [Companilactobacillus huachuanensis]